MIRLTLCNVLLLMLVCPLLAQDATPTPAPWPPDPATIFAEGVEILTEEPGEHYRVLTDYRSPWISVIDTQTGLRREYPYPIPDRLATTNVLPNGLIWVNTSGRYPGEIPLPGEVFLLNPDTGLYTEPPTVCEGKVIQMAPGKGQWTIAYHDDAQTDAFLCYSETGEQRDTLPTNLTAWQLYPNPTATHLIAIGRDVQDEEHFEVFSYRLSDNHLIPLGIFDEEYEDNVSVIDWLNDTVGVVRGWGEIRDSISFMTFDLQHRQSMMPTDYIPAWNEDTFRLENPVRYISATVDEYVTSKAGIMPAGIPCTVSIYDATGEHEHPIADDCIPILIEYENIAPFYRHNNSLYFLGRERLDATISSLLKYDIQQETVETLFYGAEIENIISVSPDGRYVVLLLDNNNVLDFSWQDCCYLSHGWQVTILDTKAGSFVYQSEPIGVYASSQVVWLDNSTVVMGAASTFIEVRADEGIGDSTFHSVPATLRQIHLGEFITTRSVALQKQSDYDEIGVYGTQLASPNPRYWLRPANKIIDLITLEPIEIFQDSALTAYSVRRSWQEDGKLSVSVSTLDNTQSITYLVTLP